MGYQSIIFTPTINFYLYNSHLNDKTAILIVGDTNFNILEVELQKEQIMNKIVIFIRNQCFYMYKSTL
jgi:hypothetical protein